MQPISSLARTLILVAIFVTLLLAGGVAFGVGFILQTDRSTVSPYAQPAQTIRALEAVEAELGYGGYLGVLARYRDSAAAEDAQALVKHANSAEAALARLDGLPVSSLRDIRSIVAGFQRTAQAAQATGTPIRPGELEASYTALRLESQRIQQAAVTARLDATRSIYQWALWAIAGTTATLALTLLATAAFFALRISMPLRQLYASLATAAKGGSAPLWGVDRGDEIGAIARVADQLRLALAEAPRLSALAQGQTLRLKLDGPSGVLFEKLLADLGATIAQLDHAASAVALSGGAGRDQLNSAAQRLAAVTADISGFASGARAEVKDAVESMRGAASSVMASGQHVQSHMTQLTAKIGQSGDHMAGAAADVSGRVTMALGELAAASEGLRMAAQEARANQSSVTAFTQSASGQTAEALGLLQSAGLNLKAALTSMEDRMSRALQSVSRLTDSLSTSASNLSQATEDTSRRLSIAAKDLEGRSKEAELRLGLALDQAGQHARASASESAALKSALTQALDDLRTARAGLETAHGSGADLSHVLSAVQDLQSLLVQKAGLPGDTAIDSLETQPMPSVKFPRVTPATRMPIAAADMLARLGSIAAEVRAAAGHDLSGLRAAAEEFMGLLAQDGAATNWPDLAARLEGEAATLSPTLDGLHHAVRDICDGLRANTADSPDGRQYLSKQTRSLLDDIAASERMDSPQAIESAPTSLPEALEATARDIQHLSDWIADLENRTATIADGAAQAAPDSPDEIQRADARTDEAIVAVMESIERLNNIAQALSRAGDFQRVRKAGE